MPELVFTTDVAAPTVALPTVALPTSSTLFQTSTMPVGMCHAPTNFVGPNGAVTFVSDNRLWSIDGDQLTNECQYDFVRSGLESSQIKRLSWSPDSTAVLLGSDHVGRGEKISASGYLPTNTDVSWSGPNGTSLLATTAKGQLVKRNSKTAKRTDISFLSKHESSAYHPAGTGIISFGSTEDDTGIFLANNLGESSRLLVEDTSAATVSDLSFSSDGEKFYFLAQHDDSTHLHVYDTRPDGQLEVAFESAAPLTQLVVSTVDSNIAVRSGDCGAEPTDVFFTEGSTFVSLRSAVPEIGGGSLSPIGWLPNNRLAVISRLSGCDGIGDLKLVDLSAKSIRYTMPAVSIAAVRVVHAPANPLQIDVRPVEA